MYVPSSIVYLTEKWGGMYMSYFNNNSIKKVSMRQNIKQSLKISYSPKTPSHAQSFDSKLSLNLVNLPININSSEQPNMLYKGYSVKTDSKAAGMLCSHSIPWMYECTWKRKSWMLCTKNQCYLSSGSSTMADLHFFLFPSLHISLHEACTVFTIVKTTLNICIPY